MAHAYRAEYEQALSYAQQIRLPAFFLDPIACAVALSYSGRQDEANAVVAEPLQLVPEFKESGRETIQRIFRYEQPVELLLLRFNLLHGSALCVIQVDHCNLRIPNHSQLTS